MKCQTSLLEKCLRRNCIDKIIAGQCFEIVEGSKIAGFSHIFSDATEITKS